MSRFKHATPKLPAELLDRLGQSNNNGGKRKGKFGAPLGRKEKRQAERAEKKSQRSQPRSFPPSERPRPQNLNPPLEIERESAPPPKRRKVEQSAFLEPIPKSILKKKSQKFEAPPPESISSPSPPPPTRKSLAVKEKLDEDDAEIAALEKRLGLKGKKKLPKSLEEDGLDDILDGLGDEPDGGSQKRKRSDYEEYLSSKRRNVGAEEGDSETDDSDSDVEKGFDVESDEDDLLSDDISSEKSIDMEGNDDDQAFGKDEDDEDLDDPFDQSDSDQSRDEKPQRVRENPYLPGVSATVATAATVARYVPPSLRGPPSSDQEVMTRLRRQLQGLLNRLSEANMLTILREIENVFNNNPRQYVTSILIDILMGMVCDRTSLTDTFMILHAGFISAVYKVIGPHFGAQILERIITEFDRYYELEKASKDGNKQASNLIALLADMYTFQVFGSRLAFDYIRLFLAELSDLNTELLLKIVKNCGHQLRQDDPSALKEIVILLQKQVQVAGEEKLPVRTKFMIQTINDLKNNRQKTGLVNANVAAEHNSSMKKTLGSLTKSSEPLGVGLEDVRGTKKEGKWWLVGASWKNETTTNETEDTESGPTAQDAATVSLANEDKANELTDLALLAKQQRMNTSIRRSIFLSIMSASDYKDAHQCLTKLKLKRTQELEIPRVIIHCAGAEQVYNPYYTLIARRLCGEHKYKWAFQYGLWTLFRRMGEKGDIEGEEQDENEADGDVDLRMLVNLGRMYGELLGEGGLSITVLKVRLNYSLARQVRS